MLVRIADVGREARWSGPADSWRPRSHRRRPASVRAGPGRRCRYCRRHGPSGPPDCSTQPIRAVVVDLPLVPVMAITRAADPSGRASSARANSSTSPRTGTPAALALSTVQCGLGWVRGAPGDRTRAAKPDQSAGQILDHEALGLGLKPARDAVVPQDGRRAPGLERARGRDPRPSQAEDRDPPALKAGNGDHGINAASASTGPAGPGRRR
jgi:hypothetical protein